MSLTRDLARLNIDSAGNVGSIGTTGPFSVSGSNGVLATLGATTELQVYADNNEISFRADADNDENDTIFTFDIDGSEKVRIDTPGHVGIGTTAPDANSFGAGHGILAVASETGSQKTAMLNLIGDGNDADGARVASLFYNDASATGAGATIAGIEAYRASNHATDPGANLKFSTNSTGNNYTSKMVISGRGYVNKQYQPCFYAYTTNDPNPAPAAGYITSGNNWNWSEAFDQDNNFSNGTFTAPIAGKYYFSLMWNRYIVQSRIAIRKNNSNYMRWEPTGRTDEAWESQQYSVLMQMAANDYVTLYGEYSGSSSYPYHMGTGQWGHFAGYLIA